MEPINSFDIPNGMMYNSTQNNDIHARVAAKYDSPVDIFKMDEHAPVNDVECRHQTLVPDNDDRIGDAIFHSCANPRCGVGFYIK